MKPFPCAERVFPTNLFEEVFHGGACEGLKFGLANMNSSF